MTWSETNPLKKWMQDRMALQPAAWSVQLSICIVSHSVCGGEGQ